MTVCSKSTNRDLGTFLPLPVSLKNVLNEVFSDPSTKVPSLAKPCSICKHLVCYLTKLAFKS